MGIATDPKNIPELWVDFLESIDGRRRPVCDIEIGHRSTSVSLLGMLSLKLGRSVDWDSKKEGIPGDPEANQLLLRGHDRRSISELSPVRCPGVATLLFSPDLLHDWIIDREGEQWHFYYASELTSTALPECAMALSI